MVALITGTSHGIGYAIANKLIANNINVIGISRTSADIVSGLYTEHLMDLTDTAALCDLIKKITKNTSIDILINNAGCGYYGLHEELNANKIHEMVTTNLEVPMLLTNLLLKDMKKTSGTIINISSVTAKNTNPHGACYGATKAALSSFANSIFAEARKYGVKVCTIHPEMTDTMLYRNANFTADATDGCYLLPEDVANAVMNALNARDGIAINDITVNPQLSRIKRK